MNEFKLQNLLKDFFIEDIGDNDLSSTSIFPANEMGQFSLYAKADGLFCGTPVIETGFTMLHPSTRVTMHVEEGACISFGEKLATIEGPIQTLLSGERVVLNLVQRLCAIATMTRKAVLQTIGTATRICDTRKTTPGLRMLEKYAVRTGGGYNHRSGLYDCIMLKDNHLAFCGSLTEAVRRARLANGHTVKIEVEVETFAQLQEAIDAGADIIMFDNQTPETIRKWQSYVPKSIITEASGGITLAHVAAYAQSGVDYISLGFLTHSVNAFDISALVELKGVQNI